jgi:SAM-dependent methyltransferase
MLTPPAYDDIGAGYTGKRKADPRLSRLIARELQDARTVVNIGAGAGSYEPVDRLVVAVEPSTVMLQQRPPGAAPAVQALAERLPFHDDAFDAAMAVLTVHHWSDQGAAMTELGRVARDRIVVLTWDPSSEGFWLHTDYFPQFLDADRKRFPPIAQLAKVVDVAQVITVPIPHDCADGFLGAYWRRPEAYLNAETRRGISSFANCRDLSPLHQLEGDLVSGKWQRRNRQLLDEEEFDLGYRLIVGRPRTSG